MNRLTFMIELEVLLKDITAAEREEALQYYNDYFDDAGSENESVVIKELGSPERVAGIIKESLNISAEPEGEFTERGYEDPRYSRPYEVPEVLEEKQEKKQYDPKSRMILMIILCIFAIPIVLPVGFSIIGVIFGAVISLGALFFSFAIASFSMIIVGVVVFIVGLTKTVYALPVAIFVCGAGLIIFAIGLLLMALSINIYKKWIPGIIRFIVGLGQKIFKRGGEHFE